jgi:outer membrane lipoprotein-sorting protein
MCNDNGFRGKFMKKYFYLIILLYSFSLINLFSQEQITPDEILLKADDARAPRESFLLKTHSIQYKDGKEVQKASMDVFVNAKNEYKSLLRFLLPQYNKDRIILSTKDAMWFFIPGTKRVIRISASQRLFGDASNGDLLSIQFQDDYNAKLEGSEIKEGKKCYKLYLTAKSPSTAYASLRYWITTDEFYPWVCEYYALSSKLLKTAYFKSFKEMLGRQRPTEFEIHNAVKTTYKTIIYYTNMELKELPDKYFQKDYMTYIRWQ